MEFIVSDAIIPELAAPTRDEAIRELVTSLGTSGAIEASAVNEIVEALVKREKTGSTGFGKGVAVPHVKHASIKKMTSTVGRSVAGLDFAALDSQPVFTIFLLLSPDNAAQQHLQAMNIIFSNLQKDMFRRFLKQSDSKQKIIELLEEADSGK